MIPSVERNQIPFAEAIVKLCAFQLEKSWLEWVQTKNHCVTYEPEEERNIGCINYTLIIILLKSIMTKLWLTYL